MRKRRGRFARLTTVFLALLVALVLTGMGYGIWSDTLTLSTTLEMGTWDAHLSPGVPDAGVSCNIIGDTLYITITGATVGSYSYTNFDVHNNGTVPVKIQSISISSPAGVTTGVSGISVNNVIDGGETLFGTVNMGVTVAAESYGVQVTINTILWTQ